MSRLSTATWKQNNTLGDLWTLRNLNKITELSLLKLQPKITKFNHSAMDSYAGWMGKEAQMLANYII